MPNQIDALRYNGALYGLCHVNSFEMWGQFAYKFLKDISPNEGNLKLFEDEYIEKNASGMMIKTQKLYIKLPNENEVFDAQSEKFIPHFDEKVVPFFSKCPNLLKKIKNKELDYFYAFVNQGEIQRKRVWMKIAFDYNSSCQ